MVALFAGQTAPVIRTLLSSFCRTASPGFDYHFYLAYDHDDPFFSQVRVAHSILMSLWEGVVVL